MSAVGIVRSVCASVPGVIDAHVRDFGAREGFGLIVTFRGKPPTPQAIFDAVEQERTLGALFLGYLAMPAPGESLSAIVGAASHGPTSSPQPFAPPPMTWRERVLLIVGRILGPFGASLRARAVKRANAAAMREFGAAFGTGPMNAKQWVAIETSYSDDEDGFQEEVRRIVGPFASPEDAQAFADAKFVANGRGIMMLESPDGCLSSVRI